MIINKINLKNFKFHKELNFDIDNNCLIYGENGTGKSSIYLALHSKCYQEDIVQYTNFTCEDSDIVNVDIDLKQDNNTIPLEDDILNDNYNTIYFINHTLLETITNSSNIYELFGNKFNIYFKTILNDFFDRFNKINENLKDELTDSEKIQIQSNKRKDIINEFELFFSILEDKANEIVNFLEEDFNITFIYDWQLIKDNNGLYKTPQITLLIDGKSKLRTNFNEAKLKLTSFAIYFAMIKIQEKDNLTNEFKLLVLDDFLTSLDMANRKLIVQYILDNFKDYQKIILTHNIQFNNIVKKLLKHYNIENTYEYKHLFLTKEENGYTANIKDKNTNYLNDARDQLKIGEYHISGNMIRKEFENIAEELKQILQLGQTESLNKIIELVNKNENENFYFEPNHIIEELKDKFIHLSDKINDNLQDTAIKNICHEKIQKINTYFHEKSNKEKFKSLVEIINKLEFYKNIAFNASSHREKDIEIYRQDCERGISLLEKLNKYISVLKKDN
jgi:energy-coupling factor transporter ATP-binding protein EcfA2